MSKLKVGEMVDFVAKEKGLNENEEYYQETINIVIKFMEEIGVCIDKNNIPTDLEDIITVFTLPLLVLYSSFKNTARSKMLQKLSLLPELFVIYRSENNDKLSPQENELLEKINQCFLTNIQNNKNTFIN